MNLFAAFLNLEKNVNTNGQWQFIKYGEMKPNSSMA